MKEPDKSPVLVLKIAKEFKSRKFMLNYPSKLPNFLGGFDNFALFLVVVLGP